MNNKSYLSLFAFVISLIALSVSGFAYANHVAPAKFGGTTNYDTLGVSALQVGVGCNNGLSACAGTVITAVNAGSCSIQAVANTIAASSTITADCQAGTAGVNSPLAGITAGAGVQLTQGTTTSTVYQGLTVLGASASSTPGYITLKLFNGTGATFTWTATASSSFTYEAFHL